MKLYIDTTNAKNIAVSLGDATYQTRAYNDTSQRLLQLIDKILKKNKKKLKDLSAIEVKTGPGSFTGIRVGISVANTLGYTLNILVNGKLISRNEFVTPVYFNKL